jgi:hypothetical protein
MRPARIAVTLVVAALAVTGCSISTGTSSHFGKPSTVDSAASSDRTVRGAGLPRCRGAWLDVSTIGFGGGLGHYYQTVTVRNLGDRACALTRLGVQYVDSSGRPIVSGGSTSPIENLARHRRVHRFGLAAHTAVYAQVTSLNPGDFSPGGCDPRRAAAENITVNGRRFHETSTLPVCTQRTGQLEIDLGLPNRQLLVRAPATRSGSRPSSGPGSARLRHR